MKTLNMNNMKKEAKPWVYIENHMHIALKALNKMNKHITKSKRLNKTDMRALVEDIKEPLMRAYGFVFPDEEHNS